MTYSLSITAASAGSPFQVKNLTLSDTDSTGDVVSTIGGQQGTMSDGDMVLCKNPDGSQSYYRIDPVRSVPGGSLVMLAV